MLMRPLSLLLAFASITAPLLHAGCTGASDKEAEDPFAIHISSDGKADGTAGVVSAEDLARIDGAFETAIARGDTTVASLEREIARLEADNQRKVDEIAQLVRQIDQRRRELEDQQRNNLIFCVFFPNPATCALAVIIANDGRMRALEGDRARAQEEQRRVLEDLAAYTHRRDELRARIAPLRASRARLIGLLRNGVPAVPVPSVLTVGSPAARAYNRVEVLRRIGDATRNEIALLVEIRNAAAELAAALDTALATVRALATDVDELLADARGDFFDMIEAVLSGNADALARDWLDDALASRTREMLAGLGYPAGDLVEHLIATRGEGEVDLAALTRSLLDKLQGASATVVHNTVSMNVLDNTDAVSTLTVPAGTRAARIEVAVRIEHTWIGDLRVSLEHGGRTFVLHERTGGAADNLMKTYSRTLPSGFEVAGAWKLHVADQAVEDEGRLLGWDLTLRP